MRRAHYLKANRNAELPQHMMFVDTEARIEQTDYRTQKQTLWLGVWCYVRSRADRGSNTQVEQWGRFTTAESFWQAVDNIVFPRTKLWLFCHNWNYDAAILGASVIPASLGWECVSYVNDDPPLMVRFRKGNRTFIMVDTLNYFRSSLRALGEGIGHKKTTMPLATDTEEAWYEYCRQDVEVVKQAVLAFRRLVEQEDLGTFQPTLAAQAMVAFRHRFMPQKILIHNDESACRLEREAYHGSRTEAYYLGRKQEDVYSLDINSMYPWIMQAFPVPTILKSRFPGITPARLGEIIEEYAAVASVRINTDEPVYPVRHQQRTVFPVGVFDTTLTTPEIRYALLRGHITTVYGGVKYDQAILFRDYVRKLYALRRRFDGEHNRAFAYLCKILLNSLYGKFGQNGQKWQDDHVDLEAPTEEWIVQETPNSPIRRFRARLGVVQELKREGETQNSFPAIAAHITAYGRMYLWDLINEAGRENVYYCDTDSLLVTKQGYDNLAVFLDPKELGKLKLEQHATSFTIWGAKDYRIGKKEKHKGIKKTARKVGDATWEQEQFRSWDYMMSKQHDGYVLVETKPKTLHRIYRKGLPTASGWVAPLVADEHIQVAKQCTLCWEWTQDWVEWGSPIIKRIKMAGWVGDNFVDRDRIGRHTGYRISIRCYPCSIA